MLSHSRNLKRPLTDPSAATFATPEALARTTGFRRIAGVDEAGRGPWAGPVVCAAVVLKTTRLPRTRIDDSKRLSPLQRTRAFEAILACADVGVGIACADEIDRSNILQATLQAMVQAVDDLTARPDLVLVDGSIAPPLAIPCWPVVGGDARSPLIACASIIAKVLRDRLMHFYHRLYPSYQFHQHKGYGTMLHARLLERWGPCPLHRLSFQPVAASRHSRPRPSDVALPQSA